MGNQRAQFFEEGDADLLEVLFRAAGLRVKGIRRGHRLDFAIKTDGLRLRGNLPFRRAKENADMAAIYRGNARRDGFRFERMINGGEQDGSVGDVNDGAAAGEIGNDFVLLRAEQGSEWSKQREQRAGKERLHSGRVAQWTGR